VETKQGRGWLENAFSLFLFVLAIWILAALWAGTTFGATFPLLADLRSQIFADYGSDIFGRTLKSLHLSILVEFTNDSGNDTGSNTDWTLAFQAPVPTATENGIRISATESSGNGDEPPVSSPTPTDVIQPTETFDPDPPAATPAPTSTPKPTKTPVPTPSPSLEPTPKLEDVEAPVLSGGILSPPAGPMSVCEIMLAVTDLEVEDYPWSSGMNWVRLKYQVDGYSDYIYSPPLSLKSGGPTGEGGWLGCYSGEIHVEINPEWLSPEPESFHINLWAKAKDNAGFEGYLWLGELSMPPSCGGNVE
jgi:hypothetical protein